MPRSVFAVPPDLRQWCASCAGGPHRASWCASGTGCLSSPVSPLHNYGESVLDFSFSEISCNAGEINVTFLRNFFIYKYILEQTITIIIDKFIRFVFARLPILKIVNQLPFIFNICSSSAYLQNQNKGLLWAMVLSMPHGLRSSLSFFLLIRSVLRGNAVL